MGSNLGKMSISKREEFDVLFGIYLINNGYLYFEDRTSKEERKFELTLDRLVNREFIGRGDRDIYGENATRYLVCIEDKGREVVEKVLKSKKGKELFRKLAEHYSSLVEKMDLK
ncbi:MAG: hypothetical protein AABX83_01025 [Nanoarchaeota archaeon]